MAPAPISSQPAPVFSYQPPVPPVIQPAFAVPATIAQPKLDDATASLAEAQARPPVQMSSYKVRDLTDWYAEHLGAALAKSPLLAPCALYTKNLDQGLRFDALCAPISPLVGENAGGVLQARFPIASIAW